MVGKINSALTRNEKKGALGRVMDFLKTLWDRLDRHDASGLSSEMTYHWVFALLPALIFLFALIGLVGASGEFFPQLLRQMHRLIPQDAYQLIQASLQELTRDSTGGLALLGLLGALWTASNGAGTVEKALNRAYHMEGRRRRNFWQKRGAALSIVVGMAVIVLICSNLVVFGDLIYKLIAHFFKLPFWWQQVFAFLRWAISIGGLVLMSAFIYSVAPETPQPARAKQIWPGALVFVFLWIGISLLFNLYVTNFGNYNKVYGPMGAIIILMLWLYLTSYALLIGGEINALLLEKSLDQQKNK
jgi:membrane protein